MFNTWDSLYLFLTSSFNTIEDYLSDADTEIFET